MANPSNISTLGSVAALRAIPTAAAAAYSTIEVAGGDSRYIWNPAGTGADNGRTIIKPSDNPATGRWNLLVAPYSVLNALDYGVIGDRVTDDTSSINNFLATAAGAGLIAFFPGNRGYNLTTGSITPPALSSVLCGEGAQFIQNTAGFSGISFTSSNCSWAGGEVNCPVVNGTSITSLNLTGLTGPITMATQPGIAQFTFNVGGFARIYSRANPANAFDGIISSYNSGTGTLILNPVFPQGSGTHTDWNINTQQTAVILNNVTNVTLDGLRMTGNWYLGCQLFAVNATGTSLSVTNCNIQNCTAVACQNRGFYANGNVSFCTFENCRVIGNGVTNYGFNINPGNFGSSVNTIQFLKFNDCVANGSVFQGFAWADNTFYTVATNCSAINCTNSLGTGTGFLFETANLGGIPSYSSAIGCTANGCDIGYEFVGSTYNIISDSSAIDCGVGCSITSTSEFITLDGFQAIGNLGDGINVSGSSVRCDLENVKCILNGGTGILINTGATTTVVSGRAFANTTANYTNNGTGTVGTITTT